MSAEGQLLQKGSIIVPNNVNPESGMPKEGEILATRGEKIVDPPDKPFVSRGEAQQTTTPNEGSRVKPEDSDDEKPTEEGMSPNRKAFLGLSKSRPQRKDKFIPHWTDDYY